MKALSSFALMGLACGITVDLDSAMSYGTNSLSEIDTKFMQSLNRSRFFIDLSVAFQRPSLEQIRLEESLKNFRDLQLQVANRISQRKYGNHRLGVNSSVPIKILNDRVYYGSLFFGSSGEEIPLMFDTGSEILAVQTIDCKDEFTNFCNELQYDYSTSNRFSKLSLALYERTYYQA